MFNPNRVYVIDQDGQEMINVPQLGRDCLNLELSCNDCAKRNHDNNFLSCIHMKEKRCIVPIKYARLLDYAKGFNVDELIINYIKQSKGEKT